VTDIVQRIIDAMGDAIRNQEAAITCDAGRLAGVTPELALSNVGVMQTARRLSRASVRVVAPFCGAGEGAPSDPAQRYPTGRHDGGSHPAAQGEHQPPTRPRHHPQHRRDGVVAARSRRLTVPGDGRAWDATRLRDGPFPVHSAGGALLARRTGEEPAA
jgi:hypothetical protein